MLALCAGALCFAGFSTNAALAQDPDTGWGGPYVGVHLGDLAPGGNLKLSPIGDSPPDTALNPSLGGSNIFGGLLAGYNIDAGSAVYGVEGDVGFGDAKSVVLSDKASVPMNVWYAANTLEQKINGHVRLRAGLTDGPVFGYVAGGLAIASTKLQVDGFCPPALYTGEASKTLIGGTIGAGVEYKISDALSVRAEYLFDIYGHATLSPSVDQPEGNWQDRELDLNTNTFRVAVDYRL
jgi:outer membrane immunogenic protein